MKKILLFSLPAVLLIFGFGVKVLTPKKPTLLNHIALHVSDLQQSAFFYVHVVQLDSAAEPFHDGNHVWLKIGDNSKLHLIGKAAKNTNYDKNAHLCFSVNSVEDFIAHLNTNNIVYENWAGAKGSITTRVDGIKQIYFQDPDGYWVEINDDNK